MEWIIWSSYFQTLWEGGDRIETNHRTIGENVDRETWRVH